MWPIKLRMLTWQIGRALKRKNPRKTIGFGEAKSVGLLFNYEDAQSAGHIRIIADKLKENGKKVKILGFTPKPLDPPPVSMHCFSRKDFSLFGKNTHPDAIAFSENAFDYLMYFGSFPCPELEQILATSKACCRMGAHQNGATPYLELMIEGPNANQWQKLYQEINTYTQKLQTAS